MAAKPAPLPPDRALHVGLVMFAAWPCVPSDGSRRRGWPTPEWESRYMELRRRLLVAPHPPASEALSELFSLQVGLRDAMEAFEVPPDIASAWEQSFKALSRAIALAEKQ